MMRMEKSIKRQVATWLCLSVVIWLAGSRSLYADRIVLRIRAGNPVDRPQPVEIKSNLPRGISTNDIMSLGGLELGYDVKNDLYYVYGSIDLGPKDVRVFDVELRDVWQISQEEITALQEQAARLRRLLADGEHEETAARLLAEIEAELAEITETQATSSIRAGASPVQHIRVFDANEKRWQRVKRDTGRLENLVLATGQDPGRLLGEVKPAPQSADPDLAYEPEAYLSVVMRLSVRNPSPDRERTVNLRHELPPEIRSYDVLDAGELGVATDFETGTAYLFVRGLELAPGESRSYDVTLRDKWNVQQPRLESLQVTGRELLEIVSAKGGFESVTSELERILAALDALAAEAGPETFNAAYINFYRRQRDRLNVLEQQLERIRSALQPEERSSELGFRAKAPDPKTTWLMIYIILGFLAVVSLLFYLRWFGRSKAETLESGRSSSGEDSHGA